MLLHHQAKKISSWKRSMTEKKLAFKCVYLIAAIIKQWCFLTLLSVIALACNLCSDAAQQTSQSQRKTVRSPHVAKTEGMPLTDSAPSITPTAIASIPVATPSTSYEVEAADNTRDGTKTFSCSLCSGGLRVSWISNNIFLQFNHINVSYGGNYTLTIYYLNSIPGRQTSAFVSVNDGPNVIVPGIQILNVNCCDNVLPQITQMTVSLHAGNNTIRLSNPTGHAPDIDRIVVG